MRKQYGLKFEEDWIAQVDAAAIETGLSRTGYIERAVELLMRQPRLLPPERTSRKRGVVRLAYICEKCDPPRPRLFLKPGQTVPRCDKPGHGRMTVQTNNVYMGKRPK